MCAKDPFNILVNNANRLILRSEGCYWCSFVGGKRPVEQVIKKGEMVYTNASTHYMMW
jgi:hypothetical protein